MQDYWIRIWIRIRDKDRDRVWDRDDDEEVVECQDGLPERELPGEVGAGGHSGPGGKGMEDDRDEAS